MAGIVEEPFKAISILYRKSHIWLSEGCEQYDLTAATMASLRRTK